MLKKLLALMSVCLVFVLCGCGGYREIDKGYLVTAIGLYNKNGKANVFMEAMSSSDVANMESERVVLSSSGNDLELAYKNLKSNLVKPLYFEQLGTVIFEGEISEGLRLLQQINNINFGIYLVKTNDVKALFEGDTVNGVLGYDIISLIRTQQQENDVKVAAQFYEIKNNKYNFPSVNYAEGRLSLKIAGENK